MLRFAKAAAAIGLASAPLLVFGMPASAHPDGRAPQYEWWLRNMHVLQAWRSGNGSGVTVALLSDGVSANQPYLAGSVVSGPDFTGSDRSPHSPYYGRIGTSLASLIAGHGRVGARSSNSWVDGIAPAAKILSIRVTLSPGDPLWSNSGMTGRLPDAIAAGIRYAVKHGATVIDLPADPGVWDPAIASGTSTAQGGSPAESSAVMYAERSGVVLVAPAGDNGDAGNAINYPAAYPGVIAVGAFGKTFIKAAFSNRRSYVALTAAGQNVVAVNKAGFTTMNTTCAAGAIVAGIAALVRSEFPNLTGSQVGTALTHGTVYKVKRGQSSGSGFGTIDAMSALFSATKESPPHARPAMLGAVPRTRPVAPAIASSGSVITRDITGDAEVSALVLAILLIPIVLYGTMAKRRDRQQALLAAERNTHGFGRSGHGSMLADPLLEFFGPQHARPEPVSSRPIMTPRFQPRPTLTGRSTMSGSLAARPLPPPAARPALPSRNPAPFGPPSPPAPRFNPAAPHAPAAQAGFTGGRPQPVGRQPDSFMGPTVRHAEVSGTPPWEPAPEPTSDLPWAVIPQQPGMPPRPPATVEPPLIPGPPDSVWDSATPRRSSAPSSLFEPTAQQPQPNMIPAPPTPPPGEPDPQGSPTSWRDLPGPDAGHPRQDSDRGPIFVWQPMESNDRYRD